MSPCRRPPEVVGLGALTLALALLLGCLVALPAGAASSDWEDELPPAPTDWVVDRAGLLSSAERAALSRRLEALERETGARTVVALYPSLPEGWALEDFTLRAVESWKVWREDRPAAALFVFRDDRQMRLEVGYGAEAVVTDLEAGEILSGVLTPAFRRGDFAGGLDGAVSALEVAFRGEFEAPARPVQPQRWVDWGFWIVLLVFFVLLPLLRRARGGRRGGGGGILPWIILDSVVRSGSRGGSFGGGGFSSGGGFSGGGGSFGGGGASGSW